MMRWPSEIRGQAAPAQPTYVQSASRMLAALQTKTNEIKCLRRWLGFPVLLRLKGLFERAPT
jgi:hypothetical protein